ncbi:MAG: M48 family metalloprotease [Pseudomonadales bacterium]|nr:M48 family metalloprotease [Pseudomonadales bacterium]
MKHIRFNLLTFITVFVAACSGVQYKAPAIDSLAEQKALTEIEAYPMPVPKKIMSSVEAERMLHRVYEKLVSKAREVCWHVKEQKTCWWDVEYSAERDFNAYATDNNRVVVYHDVMTQVSTEDELAFVIAHEIGHHIADHIDETETRTGVGGVLGAIVMGAIAVNAGPCYTYSCQKNATDAVESAAKLGSAIGSITYSVQQEKEADLLAAFIVDRSGYDLVSTRNVLIKLGAMAGKKKTGFFATHPAGPERLATFENVIDLVYLDDDGMPDNQHQKR